MASGVVLLTAQSGKIVTKDQKAAEAITEAIKALGGEKNIGNVKSLILTGTTKHSSTSSVDETEIRILLPDNYLRIDRHIGSGMTIYAIASNGMYRTEAFTGTGDRMATGGANVVNRFSWLLMGALLKGDPIASLTITAVPGTSDRFSIAKETGAFGEIEFDPVRKYPLLVSYKDVVRRITTERTDTSNNSGRPSGKISIGPGPEESVDSIMRFKDRVAVDGIMFPGTIVFESQGNAVSELKIEKVQINPKLSLTDFEIPQSR